MVQGKEEDTLMLTAPQHYSIFHAIAEGLQFIINFYSIRAMEAWMGRWN